MDWATSPSSHTNVPLFPPCSSNDGRVSSVAFFGFNYQHNYQFAWFIWLFSSFYFEKCKNLRCTVLLLHCLCKHQRLVTNTSVSLALNLLNLRHCVQTAPGLVSRRWYEQRAREAEWVLCSVTLLRQQPATQSTVMDVAFIKRQAQDYSWRPPWSQLIYSAVASDHMTQAWHQPTGKTELHLFELPVMVIRWWGCGTTGQVIRC